jgi:uncharacterized protein (TIGR00369 family)
MLFTRRTQIAFDAGQTKSSWSSTRVTPSRCRPLLMHYETARFHLFCAKVDRSVAPICALRGFMTHAQTKDVPVARLIGFEAKEIADGRAVVTLVAGQQHANPMGTLHGGILCDIADAAMGMAFASTLASGESFTTIELKINFFRPVWEARLRAEGKVVRRGGTVGYIECEITDEGGRLVAKAASTCMALRGERAKGR